jgi:hypothetical protein
MKANHNPVDLVALILKPLRKNASRSRDNVGNIRVNLFVNVSLISGGLGSPQSRYKHRHQHGNAVAQYD